jgi:ribosomal protein S27E
MDDEIVNCTSCGWTVVTIKPKSLVIHAGPNGESTELLTGPGSDLVGVKCPKCRVIGATVPADRFRR